jgi:hypothetical protein
MDRAQILHRLEEDVAKARRRRNQAAAHFDEVISGTPSGIPQPDSTERLRIASKEYTLALEAVKNALKRQNDYLVHGVAPDFDDS